MANQQEQWNNQQRALGSHFNRQHPPILPPPATLETGGQHFYPLPSLPSLGNGTGHPGTQSFNIAGININNESIHQNEHQRQSQDVSAASNMNINSQHTNHLPPPNALVASTEAQVNGAPPHLNPGMPNRTSSSSVYRPLNVKDALSYLDQVKIQFYNQSDVYNNFLDIMKDFKSQSIDTPGVIERVSTLFKGHPNLIQGFNTFLPPGYRIECSLDPSDPNPIRVTTPTGTTTKSQVGFSNQWNMDHSGEMAQKGQTSQPVFQEGNMSIAHNDNPSEAQNSDGSQIEFNHAITYVNKIKTRFANQPDIYKQFLEILQTYQREQKPIADVYEQVTELFANSPDLLEDFKQFLPDTGAQNYTPDQQLNIPKDAPLYGRGDVSQLPPVGNFQPPVGHAITGAPNQYQSFETGSHMGNAHNQVGMYPNNVNGAKKKKHSVSESYNHAYGFGDEQYSNLRSAPSHKYSKTAKTNISNPSLVMGVPEPMPPAAVVKSSSLQEELGFFDKVKKAIGNKQTYNEFLKVLNLFSQEIIDKDTLVERVDGFIGENHPDLLKWFKMFVGFDDTPQHIEEISFKKHQLELSLCKAYGSSYRQLPKAETYMPCSGRDEMCWEVLNDEWVCHPTWASEDSGFIAHRKNQYEEILFRIEEERHEFDFIMESNLRTIQTLETIANRIANMTPDQKANFKLPPGLGHTSQAIYKRIIRKVYDKLRGFEVIDALHENPAVAVPIVLKRLKQKDEEWKRSHREWNKVWREMEQKVFYKSLDHLGLTFKQADKKLLTAKQLVSEISTVKIEQQNKRLHPLTPKHQEQLNYNFDDVNILVDILRLSEIFITNSSNYSSNDREKLLHFQNFFWTSFFSIQEDDLKKLMQERTSISHAMNGKASNNGTSQSNKKDVSTSLDSNDPESGNKKRGREHDLLRDVLKRQTKARDDGSHVSPHQASSEGEEEGLDELSKMSEAWVNTSQNSHNENGKNTNQRKRDKYNLFANTAIYVFFRHLTTLYERFREVKKLNEQVRSEISNRTTPEFAKDLNLLSHQLENMGVEITGDKDCYEQVLSLSERLIKGEIEYQWFEESLRQGYRNKAYKLYTVDKVIQALVKHMYTVISDSRHSEIILLFEQDRARPVSSAREQILYRMQVRSFMNMDENMFKISYNEKDHSANIQFVSLDDLTINDHKNEKEKYNYYITSFVMSHPTEGVPASKINMPFLKSFIEEIDEDQCEGSSRSGLKVSVCENSYRLFFEADTHDDFISNSLSKSGNMIDINKKERVESLSNLLEDPEMGWRNTLEGSEMANDHEKDAEILFSQGAKAYISNKRIIDQKARESTISGNEKTESSALENGGTASNSKVLSTENHNADETMIQEANELTLPHNDGNDTTLQQELNDSTTDDITLNQDESSGL